MRAVRPLLARRVRPSLPRLESTLSSTTATAANSCAKPRPADTGIDIGHARPRTLISSSLPWASSIPKRRSLQPPEPPSLPRPSFHNLSSAGDQRPTTTIIGPWSQAARGAARLVTLAVAAGSILAFGCHGSAGRADRNAIDLTEPSPETDFAQSVDSTGTSGSVTTQTATATEPLLTLPNSDPTGAAERPIGEPTSRPAPARPAQAAGGDPDPRVATLRDPAADAGARVAAAKSLVGDEVLSANSAAQGTSTQVRAHTAEIQALLARNQPDRQTQLLLLREIASAPSAPAWMAKDLAALAKDPATAASSPVPTTEIQVQAVRGLGSVRTRESARALMALTSEPDPIGAAAFAALARLSGREDLGADRARWDTWFGQVEWLSEAQWRKCLVDSLAARADALSGGADAAIGRLLDLQRRRYQSIESMSERSTMLASLIRDELEPLQRLGFQLATQELANARALDPIVADAAASALQSELPEIRFVAASLLRLIATDTQAEAIAVALGAETDPAAAEAMLQCTAKFPLTRSIDPTLKWMENLNGSAGCGAAIEAAFALASVGHFAALERAAELRAILVRVDASKLSATQVDRRQQLLELLPQ